MDKSQLARLAKPFPAVMVKKNPNGYGEYVSHDVVTQRLLLTVGPFNTTVVDVLRGDVDAEDRKVKGKTVTMPARQGVVVGVLLALTVTIDGREVTVTEVGDCENPHNWQNDGARMKDAMSDAIKRCAMRLGLGLHLWSQDLYHLDQWLAIETSPTVPVVKEAVSTPEPEPAASDPKAAAAADLGDLVKGLAPKDNKAFHAMIKDKGLPDRVYRLALKTIYGDDAKGNDGYSISALPRAQANGLHKRLREPDGWDAFVAAGEAEQTTLDSVKTS